MMIVFALTYAFWFGKATMVAYYIMRVGVMFVGVAGPFTMAPFKIADVFGVSLDQAFSWQD